MPRDHSAADLTAAPGPTSRRIGTAVVVQLGGRLVGTAASVLTVAVTTRHLGVDDYGLLTTAIVFVALWSSLTELGVGAVIVRRVSTDREGELGHLVGVNLGLSLVYCVPLAVITALVGLGLYRHEVRVHAVLIIVCVSLAAGTVANCFEPVFMTHVRFAAVAAADAASRIITLGATIAVVVAHGDLVWFGVVQGVPTLVQIVVLAVAAHRLEPFHPQFDLAASLKLLRESIPQTGVLIVGVLYWRADAVILTFSGTVRDVGVYGLAYTVAFTLSVLPTVFLDSSLSTMTASFASDKDRFLSFVSSSITMMLFVGVPLAVFGGVLAGPMVSLLSTSSFGAPAAAPLAILLSAVALTFLTGVFSQALFAAQDQTFLLRLNVVNLTLNISLNVVLIPPFGAAGAASALVVSEISGLAVVLCRLHRTTGYVLPWHFLLRLSRPLALGCAASLLLRGFPVLLVIPAVGVVYLGASLVLGPVRPDDLRQLRARPASEVERT